MIDVYYVEDDDNIARAVKTYLERQDYRVSVFSSITGARQALQEHLPAVVLVDWNMPDGQGDALCRWVRSKWEKLPLIFLTVRGGAHDIVSGFRNGADDYVVKPFELEVLHSRICALLRRAGSASQRYLSCGPVSMDQDRMAVFRGADEVELSRTEYQLLQLLLLNKGKTVPRERLLEQLWDSSGNFVNDNTLTVTVKRLREKLGRPACLKTVRSFGYRMEDTV